MAFAVFLFSPVCRIAFFRCAIPQKAKEFWGFLHSAYKFKQDVREKTVVAVLHFFAALVAATLDVVSIAMMIRMIFSLFFAGEDNRFMMFLACVTEPFIAPIRFLLAKFNILQNSPIDWSFTISYFVIIIIRSALPVIL